MKRAAIFNPNWQWLGGGERYAAAVAQVLLEKDYSVDIWWTKNIVDDIQDRFEIDLSHAQFIPDSFAPMSFFERLKILAGYDLVFWVSDGSLPVSLAKKTLVHFQIPFQSSVITLSNRIKAKLYPLVCNSQFTKSVIDTSFGVNSKVLYPPVPTTKMSSAKKENTIVSLARFSRRLHAKRQDVLLDAFKTFVKTHKGWKLILAGGAEDEEFLADLKRKSDGFPVEFNISPSQKDVYALLSHAKIFWSATGFDIDEAQHPESVEHFGITVVEAMASGAVPVVTEAGGHKETVVHGESGYLWKTQDELVRLTQEVAEDSGQWKSLSEGAIKRSKIFDRAVFEKQLLTYL